jgi:hypothetical protein
VEFKIFQRADKIIERWADKLPIIGGMINFSGPAVEAWDAAAPGPARRPARNKNRIRAQKAARAKNRA